ncbi:hypothetical protein [uncultured Psychrobacter sp.]|uniref:hypothetical protein n=1 Tax=uncultured Psychrobacter sp. TaxID=259303 RepID=UPI0026259DB8|nr:hypothetical protein [uncultured Psychrobacter sp.]
MISSEKHESADVSMTKQAGYRIAVINSSGNTGKSLVSNYMLRPNMDLQRHYVINNMSMYSKTYSDEIILSGENFDEALKALNDIESAIVDIAADNTEYVIDIMKHSSNSHEVFNYFLVPVVKGRKELEDSLNTIKALLKLGVPSNSIKVVFNNINNNNNIKYLESIDKEFEYLLSHLDELKISYDTNAAIEHNIFYRRLSELDISLSELLSIPIDEKKNRKEYLRTKKNPERTEEEHKELQALVDLITTWRCAQSAIKNSNKVYQLLFAKL